MNLNVKKNLIRSISFIYTVTVTGLVVDRHCKCLLSLTITNLKQKVVLNSVDDGGGYNFYVRRIIITLDVYYIIIFHFFSRTLDAIAPFSLVLFLIKKFLWYEYRYLSCTSNFLSSFSNIYNYIYTQCWNIVTMLSYQ